MSNKKIYPCSKENEGKENRAMGSARNLFTLSLPLEKHPVRRERQEVKIQYVKSLEDSIQKYSGGNDMSMAMLAAYKSAFGVPGYISGRQKRKGGRFKLFIYRYCLLCDLFFLNSFGDEAKSKLILDDRKQYLARRYHGKMEQLLSTLFGHNVRRGKYGLAEYQIDCWRKNLCFFSMPEKCILVTANMSAGKSTLINALVGKTVNRTMNTACTAKIHYIYDQAYEDLYIHKRDYELTFNADCKNVIEDDGRSQDSEISISTFFNTFGCKEGRLCIVDTPGVNSAVHREHEALTKQTILSGGYDLLVYVVNGENTGTEDELRYLSFIRANVQENKIIFVVNKLDRFRKSDDSVASALEHLRQDLTGQGFRSPVICPVSGYAGFLAKKMILGQVLDEDEADEYSMLVRKFSKQEYDLSQYYKAAPLNDSITQNVKGAVLLEKSGLYGLEQILLERSFII